MHDSKLVEVPSTIHEVKLTPNHISLVCRCMEHIINNSQPRWTDEEYMNLIAIRELLESYR